MKTIKVDNIKDIKVGHVYRLYDPEFEIITEVLVEEGDITPAEEMYGDTSIMIGEGRWDSFEHEIVEYIFDSDEERKTWLDKYNSIIGQDN